MVTSTAVMPWTLTMPAGSLEQWLFTFTTINLSTGQSIPYPISGATWEYICRTNATDLTPGGIFTITTSATTYGQLVVTSSATLSTVQLTINPAATVSLVPQTYAHTLWMNQSTSTAYTWVTGNLIIVGNPQP
jgi:hypothetical protein